MRTGHDPRNNPPVAAPNSRSCALSRREPHLLSFGSLACSTPSTRCTLEGSQRPKDDVQLEGNYKVLKMRRYRLLHITCHDESLLLDPICGIGSWPLGIKMISIPIKRSSIRSSLIRTLTKRKAHLHLIRFPRSFWQRHRRTQHIPAKSSFVRCWSTRILAAKHLQRRLPRLLCQTLSLTSSHPSKISFISSKRIAAQGYVDSPQIPIPRFYHSHSLNNTSAIHLR